MLCFAPEPGPHTMFVARRSPYLPFAQRMSLDRYATFLRLFDALVAKMQGGEERVSPKYLKILLGGGSSGSSAADRLLRAIQFPEIRRDVYAEFCEHSGHCCHVAGNGCDAAAAWGTKGDDGDGDGNSDGDGDVDGDGDSDGGGGGDGGGVAWIAPAMPQLGWLRSDCWPRPGAAAGSHPRLLRSTELPPAIVIGCLRISAAGQLELRDRTGAVPVVAEGLSTEHLECWWGFQTFALCGELLANQAAQAHAGSKSGYLLVDMACAALLLSPSRVARPVGLLPSVAAAPASTVTAHAAVPSVPTVDPASISTAGIELMARGRSVPAATLPPATTVVDVTAFVLHKSILGQLSAAGGAQKVLFSCEIVLVGAGGEADAAAPLVEATLECRGNAVRWYPLLLPGRLYRLRCVTVLVTLVGSRQIHSIALGSGSTLETLTAPSASPPAGSLSPSPHCIAAAVAELQRLQAAVVPIHTLLTPGGQPGSGGGGGDCVSMSGVLVAKEVVKPAAGRGDSDSVRLTVRDANGPDTLILYIGLRKFAFGLGLVPGLRITLWRVKRALSAAKTNVYFSAIACSGLSVAMFSPAHPACRSATTGLPVAASTAAAGAVVQDYDWRELRPAPPRQLLSLYGAGPVDCTVCKVICSVVFVRRAKLWLSCASCGGRVAVNRCPAQCLPETHHCHVDAAVVIDDGTAQANLFVSKPGVLLQLLRLAPLEWARLQDASRYDGEVEITAAARVEQLTVYCRRIYGRHDTDTAVAGGPAHRETSVSIRGQRYSTHARPTVSLEALEAQPAVPCKTAIMLLHCVEHPRGDSS